MQQVKVVYIILLKIIVHALCMLETVPAGNILAPINHTSSLTISCRGTGISWEIGGHQEDWRGTDENDTHSLLTLTEQFIAMFKTWNLTIRCYMIDIIHIADYGKYVYVLRYGEPAHPTDAVVSPTSPRISWRTPAGLLPQVPVNYSVTVTDTVTDKLIQDIVTSEESVDIQVPQNTPCIPYSITITAQNDVGQSEPVIISHSFPLISWVNPTPQVDGVLLNNHTIIADVSFTRAKVCNRSRTIENYSVIVDEISVNSRVVQVSDTSYTATLNSEEIPGLETNKMYTVQIVVCSQTVCRKSKSVSLSTFYMYLDAATVIYSNTTPFVYLSCDFVSGSTTGGCSFTETESNKTYVVPHYNGTCVQIPQPTSSQAAWLAYGMDEEGNVANVAVVPNVMVDSLSHPCSTPSHGPDLPVLMSLMSLVLVLITIPV
jgi:hypothetical protein